MNLKAGKAGHAPEKKVLHLLGQVAELTGRYFTQNNCIVDLDANLIGHFMYLPIDNPY